MSIRFDGRCWKRRRFTRPAPASVNADAHPLMRQFHKPDDEKRMVVILPQARYSDWLQAGAQEAPDFMQLYPADQLVATVPPGHRQLF